MVKQVKAKGYLTINEIAEYAHVTRQAVYMALHKGLCKGIKHEGCWMITREAYDDYRANRHNRDLRKRHGKALFDIEKGYFSVRQVATILSTSLGRPYSMQRLYYLLRRGVLPSKRSGAAWIICKKDAVALLEREQEEGKYVG